MTITIEFSKHKSLKGQIRAKRRERLVEILNSIPAEIKDENNRPVPMIIDRVERNIYWVQVSIPGYAEGKSKIQINDAQKVELRDCTDHTCGSHRLVYYESKTNPKKHAMKEVHYSFVINSKS